MTVGYGWSLGISGAAAHRELTQVVALGTPDEGTAALSGLTLRAVRATHRSGRTREQREALRGLPMGMTPTQAAGSRVAGQGAGTGGPRRGHWEPRGPVARHTRWPWKCPPAAPALSSCAVKGPFRAQGSETQEKWESLRSLNEINVPFSFL